MKKFVIIVSMLISTFQISQAVISSVEGGTEGTTEQTVYGSDSSYVENTVDPTISKIIKPKVYKGETLIGNALAGTGYFQSKNMRIVDLPVAYQVNKNLILKGRIPYIFRKVKISGVEYKANGLGDILVGVDYIEKNKKNFITSTSLTSSLPTGDNEKTDNGMLVPLGEGAYNLQVRQYFYWNISQTDIEFIAGFKYYLTKNKFSYLGADYEQEFGNKYYANLSLGKNLKDKVYVEGKITYFQSENDKLTYKPLNITAKLNNDIKASDFVVSLYPTWGIFKNITTNLSLIIPLFTKYNSNVANKPRRTIAFYINAAKLF